MSAVRVSEDALNWALRHVERLGDTDIFPLPFEYQAIRYRWDQLRPYLARQDLDTWPVRPARQCLTPKGRFAFRVATHLDPLDTLLLTALTYEAGSDFEAKRVAKGLAVVHGYRFEPTADGLMYDPSYSYDSFQKRSREMADTNGVTHVVVTDIADFFPRLYVHPLENALKASDADEGLLRGLLKMLKQLNFSVSYGIPVGPAAMRLLAETAIGDVDHALLSEGYSYCRFSDDFRIFAKSEREAHEALAFLARILHSNHGLTLQPQKTLICSPQVFRRRFLRHEEEEEEGSLTDRLSGILEGIGLESKYASVEIDSLDDDTKDQIRAINLRELLEEQLQSPGGVDPFTCRFALQRLGELDDDSALDVVIANLPYLYGVFSEAMEYIRGLALPDTTQRDIGSRLLDLLDDSVLGHLEYHRCWILSAFSEDRRWDNEGRFSALHTELQDEFSRRELIVALGRAGQQHWFKTRKQTVFNLSPWERRAFLYGGSCLPGDEATHWYASMRNRCDPLETAVIEWAKANPLGSP